MGERKKLGQLSRAKTWRMGSFWEDMNGDMKVFLDKDPERKESEDEKVVEDGRARFLIKEKSQHHQEGR